jgi:FdhE protein
MPPPRHLYFRAGREADKSSPDQERAMANRERELTTEVRESLARLDNLRRTRPELAELAAIYHAIIPVLFVQPDASTSFSIGVDNVRSQLESGIPLFRARRPELDESALRRNSLAVCEALVRCREPSAPKRLAAVIADGVISPAEALHKIFAVGPDSVRSEFEQHQLDAELGSSVLRLAALPCLARVLEPLGAAWPARDWTHGYCPACGSSPLLAEIRGLEQFRWLRCGLCGSGWQVDRVYCPFCDMRDHRQLYDLYVAGEEQRFRVSVCEACAGFVRGTSTLAPLAPPMLLVAELETLHLELIARQRAGLPLRSA